MSDDRENTPGEAKRPAGGAKRDAKTPAAGGTPPFSRRRPDRPFIPFVGFEDVIANRLEFEDGVATGELLRPVVASARKVEVMMKLCRKYNVEASAAKAYSDSMSDVPMLEAVGSPVATNPDRRLTRVAQRRGWPVLRLR